MYNHLNLPRQIHFGQVGDSVVFRYTAAGQKVAKLVYQTGKPLTRTDYLGPYQYEQDSLKFFPHAEGRVLRFVQVDAANQPTVSYQREYTIKDHLGNLRLAYRAGQVRTLLATLEQDATTHQRESHQFDSLSVSAPVAQATSLAHSGAYAARLNAGGSTPQPLGPLTQLGVQQGDTITVTAFGYYAQPVQHGFLFSLGSFLAGLFHPAQAPPPGLEASRRKDLPLLQVGVGAGLASIPQLAGGVPKGYLRVLVFDKDSALVQAQTTQVQLQANPQAQPGYQALRINVLLAQDGYVTAYVGNESDVDVLFDDVSVEHRPGLQVQETQYDPAGLELAGLAAPSPGIKGLNNYRFNGKEFQQDLGLNWNHQDWRFLDLTDLHWNGVDPEVENGQESWSPYSFGYDNTIRYADADGRAPGGCDTCPTASQWQDYAAGLGTAFTSNALPIATRAVEMNASGRDQASYNAGLRTGNALSLAFATFETIAGLGTGAVGAVATVGSGGAASPVSVPVAAGGAALATHGASTWWNAARNLANPRATDENGRVNASRPEKAERKLARAAEGKPSSGGTDFVVNSKGEAVAIPNGATGPTNPQTGSGMVYRGGKGGKGMNNRTTGIRIMDANNTQGRRVNYMNATDQTADPNSGNTISNKDPRGHLPYGQ